MTAAMPQDLPALTTMPAPSEEPKIVPPPNPTVLYFTTLVIGGTPQLVLHMEYGHKVDLRYNQTTTRPTTLVIELPPQWTIVDTDPDTTISWTGDAPIWIGQIAPQIINDIVGGTKPQTPSSFTIYDPARNPFDPVVVIRKGG